MKRLSQRELLNEGFRSLVKNIAVATTKGLAKTISPTAYGVASKAKEGVSNIILKSFNFDSPKKFIEGKLGEYPETVAKVSNIKVIKKGAESFKLSNDPSIKSGRVPKHLRNQSTLYMSDFDVILRDPNTSDPINQLIPIRSVPVKETLDKDGKKTYSFAGGRNAVEVVKMKINDEPTRKALDEFNNKVLAAANEADPNNTKEVEVPPKPGDQPQGSVPRPRAYRRSRLNREAVEQKSQKSLLKHLQS